MTCGRCGREFVGVKCECGWIYKSAAPSGSFAGHEYIPPQINYCEWTNCGIPASIGQAAGWHLPRYCAWHRQIERLEPQNRAIEDTFDKFQVWRKGRVVHSPMSDQTVWDAMHGSRKLTYRPAGR
jgi:hypothetical protein